MPVRGLATPVTNSSLHSAIVGLARLKSDVPAEGDSRAFWTFVALLVALSVITYVGGAQGVD